MSRITEIKYQLLEEIYDFLTKHNISVLNAYDVDEGSSPIVQEDYSDEDNNYTLDRIYFENGDVKVDASGYWGGSDDFYLADLNVEIIESIHEWLFDNEDTIMEIVAEN